MSVTRSSNAGSHAVVGDVPGVAAVAAGSNGQTRSGVRVAQCVRRLNLEGLESAQGRACPRVGV